MLLSREGGFESIGEGSRMFRILMHTAHAPVQRRDKFRVVRCEPLPLQRMKLGRGGEQLICGGRAELSQRAHAPTAPNPHWRRRWSLHWPLLVAFGPAKRRPDQSEDAVVAPCAFGRAFGLAAAVAALIFALWRTLCPIDALLLFRRGVKRPAGLRVHGKSAYESAESIEEAKGMSMQRALASHLAYSSMLQLAKRSSGRLWSAGGAASSTVLGSTARPSIRDTYSAVGSA